MSDPKKLNGLYANDEVTVYECYDSMWEFENLWNTTVEKYARHVESYLKDQMWGASMVGKNRLIWLNSDFIMHGIVDLFGLQDTLKEILMKGTKNSIPEFCIAVNNEVVDNICTTCRTYIDTCRHHQLRMDTQFMATMGAIEARTKLGDVALFEDGIPLYWNNPGFVDILIRSNCTENKLDGEVVSFYHNNDARKIVMMFLMTNSRKDSSNVISIIKKDLILSILKISFPFLEFYSKCQISA